MGGSTSQRPKIVTTKTLYGVPTTRRHVILMSGVGNCMENQQAVSGDKKESNRGTMDEPRL